MFEESIAGHFLLCLASLFGQSLIVNALKRAFARLWQEIRQSVCVNIVLRFFGRISEKVRESLIYDWLGKSVFTKKYYENSYFYHFLNFILGALYRALCAVRRAAARLTGSSLTHAAAVKISGMRYFSVDIFLAVFIGVMFIAPHDYWNNLYAVLASFFFAAWILLDIASGKLKAKRAEGISLSLIVFVIAVAVSCVTAIVFSDALRIALFMAAAILFMLEIYACVDTREKLVRFTAILLFFVTLTALCGFYQRASGVEVDLEFVDVTANEGMPGRVFSTFSNPNNFAELLLLFMPFFVPLFLCVKKKSAKTAVLAAFCVSVGALLMTYSRSCWVGFALAAVLFVVLYDKRLLIPTAILVIAAVPFLPDTVMNRIFTIGSLEDTSNSYRLYIWESCLKMVRDFFATGIGLGPASFKAVYPGYASSFAITAPHSHMLYMELVLEVGAMGFLSFFAYIYTAVKSAAGAMRIMDKKLRSFAIAALSSLLGIAFVCCAEYIWFYPRVMFAFWMVPGIMASVVRIGKNEARSGELWTR